MIIEARLPGFSPGGSLAAEPPTAVATLGRHLSEYFDGDAPLPPIPARTTAAGTTTLAKAIYRCVGGIRRGSTMTYAQVAEKVGRPGAARAVGAAMARNRLAPIIPCHRVVGSDGSLRGYAGGLAMKQALLEMERDRA